MLAPNVTSIEMFWRAANYLTVGMLYLEGNPLLREELNFKHFKKKIHGHWGACPAINAIYAHVSDLSRRTGRRMRLVVGSGHAGPAILSSLYLEGTLENVYPQFTRDLTGLTTLFRSFGSENGFSTEITPEYPGAIYAGGELGAALAFSQGYVLRNLETFCVCVIGDGELETSVTQASWQGFRFLSGDRDGRVLPIINANGYKMGSHSLHSLQSRDEHERLFEGYGLRPIFVGPNHRDIAVGFDAAYSILAAPGSTCQPVIVLETPKGWSGPSSFGDRLFAGTANSHKPILKNPSLDHRELNMIEAWLRSYRPVELFDVFGVPHPEISDCLPLRENVLGMSHQICHTQVTISPEPIRDCTQPIEAVSKNLIARMRAGNDFLIFSPDELGSNKLGELLQVTTLKYGDAENPVRSSGGQVLEILNEHLCYAWSQGFSAAGHCSVFISFEAFAPMLDSMVAQYLKFLKRCAMAPWRPVTPAINIILTSLGWHNTPTHHNPGCVDNFIGRQLQHVKIFMPITASAASLFLSEMLDSVNRVNIMVLSKHHLSKLSSIAADIDGRGQTKWRQLTTDGPGNTALSLIAIGDCIAEEALFAKDIINERCPHVPVQVIAIERLNFLEDPEDPDRKSLLTAIRDSSGRVFAYNGYPTTIQGVLWDMGLSVNTTVLGYRDEDGTPSGVSRFIINRVSRFDIAEEAMRLLSGVNQGSNCAQNALQTNGTAVAAKKD